MDKNTAKQRLYERYRRGNNAEILFVNSMLGINPNSKIVKATKEQDMFDHIDYFVDGISYDVKSLKKVSARDQNTNENIVWVELKNVRGNKGWLYGKCDRIAFELNKSFALVDREDLVRVVEKLIIDKHMPFPVLYHKYGRSFSQQQVLEKGYICADEMTLIEFKDIKDIVLEYIPKV